MASRRDDTVYCSGMISTFKPASWAVFAVMGPIQAILAFLISDLSPIKVKKFLTVEEEVKVMISMLPSLSLFSKADVDGEGRMVW